MHLYMLLTDTYSYCPSSPPSFLLLVAEKQGVPEFAPMNNTIDRANHANICSQCVTCKPI